MHCDYKALDEYKTILNRDFNSIVIAFNHIEDSLKKATNTNTWNSKTCDYFEGLCNEVYSNFETVNNKLMNIMNYLDAVIANYQTLDNM